jgi:peptide/nickel transport system substrate-binding protein
MCSPHDSIATLTLPGGGATVSCLLPPRIRILVLLLAAIPPACRGRQADERLAISVPYQITTLDPHVKNTLSNFALISHFYEPLVTTDASLRIQPYLAQLWENPDPTTWIFHLRPGVTFADGRPLEAEDVVFTIHRLQTTPGLEIANYILYLKEATALDSLTVRIRTERPLSILLNKLRFVPIVPRDASAVSLSQRPNGSGPYTLAGWEGNALRLTRREAYWGKTPVARNVTFYLDRMPEAAAADLIAGRAQLAQCNSKRAEQLVRADPRFEIARRPSLFIKYLGYDVARAKTPFAATARNPFRDPLVREALDVAIDRKQLVAGLANDAIPAGQLVPPTIFGFNPKLATPVPDQERARALLRRAGYPEGFAVTLHTRKLLADAATLVAAQLREVGVRASVVSLDDPDFLEGARQRRLSFYVSRFGCPTGDVSDILDVALHSTDAARHLGLNNYGGYSNPKVDAAIEESAGIENVRDRRVSLEAITEQIMADRAWIPLYVDQDVYAMDRTLAWTPRNDSFILAAEVGRR